MVTREYMLQAARRCDTQMARAFLKALGYTPPNPFSKRSRRMANQVKREAYRDMDECRRQSHGVVWRDG